MKHQTICTDCGRTAIVRGTPDDYEVICNHCDPRGPVVKGGDGDQRTDNSRDKDNAP